MAQEEVDEDSWIIDDGCFQAEKPIPLRLLRD
jgi:hypothetical protein